MRHAYSTAIPLLLVATLSACDNEARNETALAPGAPLPLSDPLTTERTIAPSPPVGNVDAASALQPTADASGNVTTSAIPGGVTGSAGPDGATASAGSPAAASTGGAAATAAGQGAVGTTSSSAGGLEGGTAAARYDAADARVMDKLLGASNQLREALQEMAQQPSSAEREQAMKETRQALHETQQAMIRVPTAARAQKQ